MLFYNEEDAICNKISDSEIRVLYDWDIVDVNGQLYTYSNGYFYEGIDYGDGDYETNWDVRLHPRKMNILEMDEV